MTPTPDVPRTRTDDPDAPPSPHAGRRGSTDSSASDEISVLLSSSLESPEPDPMLGGSSSWDLARVAERQDRPPSADPTAGLDVGVDLTAPVELHAPADVADEGEAPVDWSGLLLRSYASALTLGVAWLLWSGKASPPPAPSREAPSPPPRRRSVEPAPATIAESPSVRSTTLGRPIVVGDLEVTPLLVLRKGVRVVRSLGEESLLREHGDCLALTVRLKNVSANGAVLRPIDVNDLIDGDAFAIDVGAGPKIAMFALAPGGGWTIEEQAFPDVAPGEVVDVVLFSEPLGDRRLPSNLTWRFRVTTDPRREQREDLAVSFGPRDLP